MGMYDQLKKAAEKSIEELEDWIKSNQFVFLTEGLNKKIFIHANFPEYVFKVYKGENSFTIDSYFPLPPKIKHIYLEPVFNNRKLIIQDKCNLTEQPQAYQNILAEVKNKIGNPRLYDIIEKNCGILKGKAWLFDYVARKENY